MGYQAEMSDPVRPALISLRIGADGLPAVERALGVAAPRSSGLAAVNGSVAVFALGPDEWLIRTGPDEEEQWLAKLEAAAAASFSAVVLVSRRLACLHGHRPRGPRCARPGDRSGRPSVRVSHRPRRARRIRQDRRGHPPVRRRAGVRHLCRRLGRAVRPRMDRVGDWRRRPFSRGHLMVARPDAVDRCLRHSSGGFPQRLAISGSPLGLNVPTNPIIIGRGG